MEEKDWQEKEAPPVPQPPQPTYQPPYETSGVRFTPPVTYVPVLPYGMTPGTFEEKKKIRKTALMVGLSLMLTVLFTIFWASLYGIAMAKIGLDPQKAIEALQKDAALMQALQIVLSLCMFLIPFGIVFKTNGLRFSELVPLTPPKRGNRFAMFLFGISFCAFANIAVSMMSDFLSGFGIDYHVDYGDNPPGFFGFLLSFLATVVTPALVEEFACRGLVLGSLRQYGDGFALVVTSVLFGLLHGNFEQMPFAFLVGLVLGFIVIQTGSLWIAVAVHAFNNFISVFFTYFMVDFSQAAQNAIYGIFLMICLLAGLFALFLTGQKSGGFTLKSAEMEATEKQKAKWFFTSPPVIIFTALCILESFFYF